MAIQLKNLLINAEDGSFTIDFPDGTTSTKQFRQRSFTYGPGAGQFKFDTDPPFIIKDFNGDPLPGVEQNPNSSTGDIIGEVTDNFVRGGVVTLAKRAIDDVERLGKVIISPNGLAWATAQLALTATNPKNIISPRNRLTLPVGTLLTAGTGAAGIRFRKDGLVDVKTESGFNYDPTRGGKKYESSMLELSRLDADDTSDHTLRGAYFYVNAGGFENREDLIKSYSGGAHSLFGIGNTEIKRYQADPYRGYLPLFNQDFFKLRQGPNQPSGDIELDSNGEPLPSSENFSDYRTIEDTPHKSKPVPKARTRMGLYNVGDPGKNTIGEGDPTVYNITSDVAIDKLSAATLFKRENVAELDPEFKDYIKFRIAVVDTDNPLNDTVMVFRALLDNIQDSFSGDWNTFKYNGRAEEFYTYNGFSRSITFGFKIHTQTRREQQPLWNKLNYLVAQTAPEYKNRRMRGVFSRLTIGDWMHEIPGFFRSVDLGWNVAYPWEIKNDPEGLDNDVNQYPHILDVSCNFQPIHNFAPTNSPTTPFILPDKSLLPKQKEPQVADGQDDAGTDQQLITQATDDFIDDQGNPLLNLPDNVA